MSPLKTHEEIRTGIQKMASTLNEVYFNKSVDILLINQAPLFLVSELSNYVTFSHQLFLLDINSEPNNEGISCKFKNNMKYRSASRNILFADGVIISGQTHFKILQLPIFENAEDISFLSLGIKDRLLKYDLGKIYSIFHFDNEMVEGFGIGQSSYSRTLELYDLQ